MTELKEKPLTIKALQKHIVYTIIGCIIVTIVGGITTSFAFYHKTNNEIANIIENDKKQDASINKVYSTVNQINEKLGSTNTVTAVSDEKIKGLENQIQSTNEQMKIMQQTQLEMLKMLSEIKRK